MAIAVRILIIWSLLYMSETVTPETQSDFYVSCKYEIIFSDLFIFLYQEAQNNNFHTSLCHEKNQLLFRFDFNDAFGRVIIWLNSIQIFVSDKYPCCISKLFRTKCVSKTDKQ